MTVREWQTLSPTDAAHEVHARANARLSAAQRRAAIAVLSPEQTIAAEFAHCARDPDHPLGGVPCMVKDLFDIAGMPTFAGSTFLPEVRRTREKDGALVRAVRAAGLVCVGKTHLHEFAYGITGENPHYGDCEHPQFPGRTTGGSSSGSAAAVAAGIVPIAFGTDTGGSIRVPAAFCGLFGIRLAPGDAWIRDAFPLAPSLDTAGWFTANAADMRATIRALIGSRPTPRTLHGCFVELPGLDDEVGSAFRSAAERFAPRADATTHSDLTHGFTRALDAYNVIVAAEAWATHAPWAEHYRQQYDPAVWQRLSRGRALSHQEVETAELTRASIRLLWTKFFLTYDFLVLPASPCAALTKAECTFENRARLLALTTPVSLGGLPVLTIPIRLPSGLTTGLQIVVNQPQSPAVWSALARAEEEPLGVAR